MLGRLRSWWLGRQVLAKVGRQDVSSLWPSISELWRTADCLFAGPTGPDASMVVEYAVLVEVLKADKEGAARLLRAGLSDPSPYVVAYCIHGLGLLGQVVQPSEFGGRTDQVRWRVGSRTGESRLSEVSDLSAL